ncbi:glycerophosphodiester phosphodiesterase family protein [Flavobacteriaceae bacterium]|nr:glycerophosphodiester phosphodiesterase family protein [Flavobacteriaceae bacterium]MDC1266122.1 glycerophosphodiester phosphodiesterase family protein [Flavobacteriaceae bacterium]
MKNTKSIYFFLLLSVFMVLIPKFLNSQERPVDAFIAKFLDPNTHPGMMIAAHRGYWYTAPENSIKAIEEAITMGADMAEVDVNKTSDGTLVLLHDSALERTTSIEDHPNYENIKQRVRPGTTTPAGEALLANVTWSELNQTNGNGIHYVKLKNRHGRVYYEDPNDPSSYQTIPLIPDVLEAVKGKILINLDKADRYLEECWAFIDDKEVQDQTITKGYLTLWELKQKYDEGFLNEIMTQHIYTPISNDKLPYDHFPDANNSYLKQNLDQIENSIGLSMQDFLNEQDSNGNPWADAFEPNPESLNSPIINLVETIAKPNNRRVGTFSAFADLGEGHAINKGRWKFDPPFELRQNWDLSTKNGINYIITDRIKFLQEYKNAIENPVYSAGYTSARSFVNTVTPESSETDDTFLSPNVISSAGDIPVKRPILIATHRAGNGSLGPENTLSAIKECINSGVNIIEIDVSKSSDGVYYIFHDQSLKKMTDVADKYNNRPITVTNDDGKQITINYALVNYSSQEINTLKLRNRLNANTPLGYSNQKIPTLEETLDLCNDKILIRLDKWDDTLYRQNNLSDILSIINNKNMFDQIIFGGTTRPADVAAIFGTYAPQIRYSPVFNPGTEYSKINAYINQHNQGNFKIPFFRIRAGNVYASADELTGIRNRISHIHNQNFWTYNSLVLTGLNSQSGPYKDDFNGWAGVLNLGTAASPNTGISIIETDRPLELKNWLSNNQNYCIVESNQPQCD